MDKITYYKTHKKLVDNTGEVIKPRKLLRDGIDTFGEPVRAERWMNVMFDKKGNYYRGFSVFPSAEEAAKVDAYEIAKYSNNEAPYWNTKDGLYLKSEHSHTIQLPVRA